MPFFSRHSNAAAQAADLGQAVDVERVDVHELLVRVRMPSVHGSAPKQPALTTRSWRQPASRIDSPKAQDGVQHRIVVEVPVIMIWRCVLPLDIGMTVAPMRLASWSRPGHR